jgi:alpha-methylacyl-CoA racemase
MLAGSAYMSSFLFDFMRHGFWNRPRGKNLLDSGAPHYDVYTCSDGQFISVGALEPQFLANFVRILSDNVGSALGDQIRALDFGDESRWAESKEIIKKAFVLKTRDQWSALFHGAEACVTPVLSAEEARAKFPSMFPAGLPAPAPTLSRTPAQPAAAPLQSTDDTSTVLNNLGIKAKL